MRRMITFALAVWLSAACTGSDRPAARGGPAPSSPSASSPATPRTTPLATTSGLAAGPSPSSSTAGSPTELFAAQRSAIDVFRVSDGRRIRTVVTAGGGRELTDLALSRRDVLFVDIDVSRGELRCGSEAPVVAVGRDGGGRRWVSERRRFASNPTTTADGQRRAYLLGGCYEDDGGEGAPRDLVMTDEATGQRRVVELPGWGVSGMAIAGDLLVVSASQGEFDGVGPRDTGLRVFPFGTGLRDLSKARRLAPPRDCHWNDPVALPGGSRVVVLESCQRRYTAVVVDLDSGRVVERVARVVSSTGALLHLDVDASGRHLLIQDGYGTQSVEGRPRPARTDRLTLRTKRVGDWTVTVVRGVDEPTWD